MAKGKVQLGLDASQMSGITGLIDGFATTIQTDKLISTVVGYVQSELGKRFGEAVDSMAEKMPGSFLHVYEWGNSYHDYSTIGRKQFRLWRLTQVGTGRSRAVSFVFLPSVKPVPIHPDLLDPGESGKAVKEGVHVFTWKAPIMEYGIRVTVRRLEGTKALAFIDNRTGEIRFSKGPHTFQAGVSPHGQPNQRRVFTSFFINWWSSDAEEIYETELRPRIENDISPPKRWDKFVRRYKPRAKEFSIQTTLQGHRNFNSARRAAREELEEVGREYARKSSQGRLGKFGYE